MRDLFLVRGLPGSGKSTVAESLAGGIHPVYSADDYFMVDGEYQHDPARIPDAHAHCIALTEAAMAAGTEKVFVANTFVKEWEMAFYTDLAEKYGYRVHRIVVENAHGGRNVHGVPAARVREMAQEFDMSLLPVCVRNR